MRRNSLLFAAATMVAAVACGPRKGREPEIEVRNTIARSPAQSDLPASATPSASGEAHLSSVRQLTAGGENAEAYFSADGMRLIFQSARDGRRCDQQYVMSVDGTGLRRVSSGDGKTTCGYFFANDRKVFFASTHASDTACPPRPDPSRGYVWGLDPFDIYTANTDGSALHRITNYGIYTAEGTLSPDGKSIVFTSLKDGDLDIYTMNVDGSGVRRLTTTPGYDGGPFFSPDGTKIVYRANHPADSADLLQYRNLLVQRMIRPNRMEIWIMNADGSDQRQITSLGGANFAPSFTPDGHRIIFSSNHRNPRGPAAQNFDLFLINSDGSGLEQVTNAPEFDGFPMFSPDGTKLVWASNRNAQTRGETNIFLAEWK
ncbi:MAG: TolB family protein [Gemmatimonadaceae bacterium]